MRANPLAQKIVASDIALGLTDNFSFYTPDNCKPPVCGSSRADWLTTRLRGIPEQHRDALDEQLYAAEHDAAHQRAEVHRVSALRSTLLLTS